MGFAVIRRIGVLGVCLAFSSLCWAGIFEKDQDPDAKPWTEAEVKLPDFPEAENLIPFTVGVRTDIKYFVDGKSISVGEDGLIRYTLVITSARGARNISFEGMRCETAERRAYAFGHQDGTWSPARSDRWVRVSGDRNVNHYAELFASFFCAAGEPTLATPDDVRRVLRRGGVRH